MIPKLLQSSVIAVPPLCRTPNGDIAVDENLRMISHLKQGGVSTLLYGGNAAIHHLRRHQMESLIAFLTEQSDESTTIIPSVGPTFGLMMDYVQLFRDSPFPCVMVLPTRDAVTSDGVCRGMEAFANETGKPVLLYIKDENYITPADAGRLVEKGIVAAVKYAIVRENPAHDSYLEELIKHINVTQIISGMGEQPAPTHFQEFGVRAFTSGCVCIAPALSTQLLRMLSQGEWRQAETICNTFADLETLRNQIHPVRVLHAAVTLAGVADCGPLPPLLSAVKQEDEQRIASAAKRLLADDAACDIS